MLTSLQITAPAGSCDCAGRSTDHLARGCARGPIPKSIHDPADKASYSLPAIKFLPTGICPPPVHLGAPGSDRGASFIRSQRGKSCKIIRASQHFNLSLKNSPCGSTYRVEVPGCGKSHLEIEKLRRVT